MYKDKKIFILGLARSGYEVAKLLINDTKHITLVDENKEDKHINELEQLGIKVIISNRDEQEQYLDSSFDLIVKNPGVSPKSSILHKAKELNIKIINEVEVAYQKLPKGIKIIGITGSNGKTTTTTLTYEILKEAGLPVHLAGNIGFPLSSFVNVVKENDIIVMEVSCQQLNDVYDFKTDISVLTNINESHLDFFDTLDKYKDIKKKIFNHHNENDIAIINSSDKNVLEITFDIKSKKVTFSTLENADLYLQNTAIYYKDTKIIDLKDIKLVGNHNYENCMCAIAIAKEFNVSNEIIFKVLNTFAGVEHRLQFVKEVNGRLFYNDSKATNTTATLIALKSFTSPLILLLGGMERNHSLDELLPFMNHVKHVVCYGEVRNRFKEWCNKNNIPNSDFDTLKEAVNDAYKISNENDTILLSPACASWDQYEKFEDRGDDFINIVNNL